MDRGLQNDAFALCLEDTSWKTEEAKCTNESSASPSPPRKVGCSFQRAGKPDGGRRWQLQVPYPRGKTKQWGERPKLHLAHSLSILPLLSFEPSVERCWLRKAVRWAVRMEYADIQKEGLPPVLPKPTRTHIRPVTIIGTRSRVAKPFTTQRL